jgi:predicted PurR-regulated permease PerM
VESVEPTIVQFVNNSVTKIDNLLKDNPDIQNWIVETFDIANLDLSSMAKKLLDMLGSGLDFVFPHAVSAISSVASGFFSTFVSVAFAIYALFQKETLARQGRKILYALLPEKTSDYIVRVMRLSNSTFSNFLSGQCVEVCILGTMFAIAMTIFGMPYVPLISVLIAVTAFIPVVGAWVGCIFGAFFILVANPLQALWFVIMFLVLQQIENNLIYPRVVGTSIGLSGMWVLVAVAIGGELMGVAGMFLMIPVASVIYTLLREAINKRLAGREIDEQKLMAQPPEIKTNFKSNKQDKTNKESVESKKDS